MKALNLMERQVETAADAIDPRASAGAVGVMVGTLVGFSPTRKPLVLFDDGPHAIASPARTTVDLDDAQVGRQVLLMCERGDRQLPIVIGWLREPQLPAPSTGPSVEVEADGTRVVISARERLVLRCGRASITLTNSGKVLIDGEFTSMRAVGVARIKGGAVQIN